MNEFETFYRQQIERLERELKRASDQERESIERELAVYRVALEKMKGGGQCLWWGRGLIG